MCANEHCCWCKVEALIINGRSRKQISLLMATFTKPSFWRFSQLLYKLCVFKFLKRPAPVTDAFFESWGCPLYFSASGYNSMAVCFYWDMNSKVIIILFLVVCSFGIILIRISKLSEVTRINLLLLQKRQMNPQSQLIIGSFDVLWFKGLVH